MQQKQETALALSGEYAEIRALSREVALSQLLPQALRNKPADVLAITLAGKEMGLGIMQSIRGFDVIVGKLAMSSALIGAMIQSSPSCEYLIPVEATEKIATFKTRRKGWPVGVETVISFTIEEAKKAGLTEKDNYRKNPTAMLLARAQARIGRAVYPDVMFGVYDRDSGELDEVEVNDPPSSQAAHVEAVKETIRAQVMAPAPKVVEGTVVSVSEAPKLADPALPGPQNTPAPAPDPTQVKIDAWLAKFKAAKTVSEMRAMVPAMQAEPVEVRKVIKPVWQARGTEVSQ